MAGGFFAELRERYAGEVACEPRHESWFRPNVERLLESFRVARVAADPAVASAATEPGGWDGLAYYRLHGTPRIYYSAYPPEFLRDVERRIAAMARPGADLWCIFDNTAEGHAVPNALEVLRGVG